MKHFILILATTFIASGCASMLPKISETHPSGFNETIKIAPQCENTTLEMYYACSSSAEIFQAPSPGKATSLFIMKWEQTVFPNLEKMKDSAKRHDLIDSIMNSNQHRKDMTYFNDVIVPSLYAYYKRDNSIYSQKMSRQLDIIELESQSSFDTFRESHSKFITEL